jgi:hypothetical protein
MKKPTKSYFKIYSELLKNQLPSEIPPAKSQILQNRETNDHK